MSFSTTTTTFCGTPEYIAPEIVLQQEYTRSVDWWSFGIIIFEMLTGLPPFYHQNINRLYKMIVNSHVKYPDQMSPDARDLISRLLDRDISTRLGASELDYKEIQQHPFFKGIDWDKVLEKKYVPEWVPQIVNETDTSNFDEEFTKAEEEEEEEEQESLNAQTQKDFVGFTCTPNSVLQ